MTGFFNTTSEQGDLLKSYRRQARTQSEKILAYFQETKGLRSPSEVQFAVLPRAPITSVRRAMTCLTDDGYLAKCEEKVPGQYGRPEHLWRLTSKGRNAVIQ